ncbi:MAG: hypothetical protein L0G22_02895 [Propionibacteriaceae bacterium]|nr:hypothetical protein [Propionibacteriaceae bacterium]
MSEQDGGAFSRAQASLDVETEAGEAAGPELRDADAEVVDAGAQPPHELESLLLSAALVVGLVLFALGCTVLDWFG